MVRSIVPATTAAVGRTAAMVAQGELTSLDELFLKEVLAHNTVLPVDAAADPPAVSDPTLDEPVEQICLACSPIKRHCAHTCERGRKRPRRLVCDSSACGAAPGIAPGMGSDFNTSFWPMGFMPMMGSMPMMGAMPMMNMPTLRIPRMGLVMRMIAVRIIAMRMIGYCMSTAKRTTGTAVVFAHFARTCMA